MENVRHLPSSGEEALRAVQTERLLFWVPALQAELSSTENFCRGNHFTAGEYSYVCTDAKKPEEMDSYWGMSSGAEGLAKIVAKHTGEDWQTYDG